MRLQAPAQSNISTLARDWASGLVPKEGRDFGLGAQSDGSSARFAYLGWVGRGTEVGLASARPQMIDLES